MKRNFLLILVTAAAAISLLAACTRTTIPVAASYQITTQQRMQAAHHWSVLAEHVANRIHQKLEDERQKLAQSQWGTAPAAAPLPEDTDLAAFGSPDPLASARGAGPATGSAPDLFGAPVSGLGADPYGGPVSGPGSADPFTTTVSGMEPEPFTVSAMAVSPEFAYAEPVLPSMYISPPRQHTPFGIAFHNLLTAQLVNKNFSVVTNPDAPGSKCYMLNMECRPLILNYEVQVVQHHDRKNAHLPIPGLYSIGAAGVWLVAHILDQWQDRAWAVLPLAIAADAATYTEHHFPGETDTEVIISATISDGDLVVFSDTNIYYINAGDDDHYEKGTQTYKVVGEL